jgi:hypothetical protein
MSRPQFFDLLLQEFPGAFGWRRLRRYSFGLGVGEGIDNHRGEDLLDAAQNVTLDDLRGDVGDEGFLRNLDAGLLIGDIYLGLDEEERGKLGCGDEKREEGQYL